MQSRTRRGEIGGGGMAGDGERICGEGGGDKWGDESRKWEGDDRRLSRDGEGLWRR